MVLCHEKCPEILKFSCPEIFYCAQAWNLLWQSLKVIYADMQ